MIITNFNQHGTSADLIRRNPAELIVNEIRPCFDHRHAELSEQYNNLLTFAIARASERDGFIFREDTDCISTLELLAKIECLIDGIHAMLYDAISMFTRGWRMTTQQFAFFAKMINQIWVAPLIGDLAIYLNTQDEEGLLGQEEIVLAKNVFYKSWILNMEGGLDRVPEHAHRLAPFFTSAILFCPVPDDIPHACYDSLGFHFNEANCTFEGHGFSVHQQSLAATDKRSYLVFSQEQRNALTGLAKSLGSVWLTGFSGYAEEELRTYWAEKSKIRLQDFRAELFHICKHYEVSGSASDVPSSDGLEFLKRFFSKDL